MGKQRRDKGYYVKHTYDNDFVDLMSDLYDKYGEDIFSIQGIANKHLDLAHYSRTFYNKSSSVSLESVADSTVDPNANVKEKSIVQYNHESHKPTHRLNSLYLIYRDYREAHGMEAAKKALEHIISGSIFINDLHHWQMSYCYSIDTRIMLSEGIQFIKSGVNIRPPKRLESFTHLLIQAIGAISNQIAGAVTIPDYFILFDYFARQEFGENYIDDVKGKDSQTWYVIKNYFQNFIYSICIPLFRVSQSPFVNVSIMDKGFMSQLFSGYMIPNPTDKSKFDEPNLDSTYELQKLFFEYFDSINMEEGVFTFPVVTLAISLDESNEYIDQEFAHWAAKHNHNKGLSNIYQGPPTSLSSCCRMRSDTTKVSDSGFQNSFGVAGLNIGSTRVCGINLPRLSLIEKENPDIRQELIDTVHNILVIHRKFIKARAEQGYLPLYEYDWIHLNKQYSTFGFIGAHEFVENKGLDIRKKNGQKILIDFLAEVESNITTWQEEELDIHSIYNIEQIPGESVAVRLAKIDNLLGYNNTDDNSIRYQLYSNQYLPLTKEASLYDRLRIQGIFDKYTSGGSILHLNIDDEKPLSEEQYFQLMNTARQLGVIYFAVNYAFSECESGHILVGKHDTCKVCDGKIIQQYTRVVGFITPTSSWISERKDYEYPQRKFYQNKAVNDATVE